MNNREIYIIFSPGRTGSHIILEAISGIENVPGGLCNATCYWHPNNPTLYESYAISDNIVIHTHMLQDALAKLNIAPKDATLILSYRRNIFEQVMSVLVAQVTNEWSGKNYSDKLISPVSISQDKFNKVLVNLQNQLAIDVHHDQYKKIITIFYEDLVVDAAEHIASKLNIKYDKAQVGTIHRKSPYRYKDWILNWQELYQEFCKNN
jgi:LPS sulfotransferase NodH